MKKLFLLLCVAMVTLVAPAQNVGIGTTTPNAKAALEINSTSKGLLIPTMTTSQLYDISSPPNGLLVYNSSYGEMYQYNGSTWQSILNSSYWIKPITNRKLIANRYDSVGIGMIIPSEWLDVNGNIRSRSNISADNNLKATGSVSGGSLFTSGNATVAGTTLLYGAVSTYNDVIMNGTAATLQLRSGTDDKAFLQLSGNDLRMGTNSANAAGKFIVRTGGANRMYVDAAGNVSINTSSIAAGYVLNIKGKAICEELKVQLSGGWPDYVFADNYELKPLQEVAQFIAQNRHLPNIPPAAEIEKNGLEVGDMQKRMMEKIEELTLYLIQLEKEVIALKTQMAK